MGVEGALLVIAGLAGLYFWNLSRAVTNLTFTPGNITGLSLSGISPVITVELIVQNTSNVDFTINSLAGNVTTDSTIIGNVSNFTPVIVRANSQGSIPLTLTLQPIGLVSDIINIISNGLSSVGNKTIAISGSVNANGVQSPFSLSYKIGL